MREEIVNFVIPYINRLIGSNMESFRWQTMIRKKKKMMKRTIRKIIEIGDDWKKEKKLHHS